MGLKQALDVLNEIENTSGKNDKRKLLKDNSNNKYLAELLDAAFNYNRVYHIKKFDENQTRADDIPDNYRYFIDIVLYKLENRDWTGNNAIELVENFFKLCDPIEQKWFSRVLRKDLKCGFSAETAVKAGFTNIPIFDVMLAKDGKLCKKLNEVIKKGVYVSPKLDGYRCLAIVNEGSVTLLSRNGTEYHNFPSIVESFQNCFPTGKFIFDGEIMSDDFQSMQKTAFSNKSHQSVGDVGYYAFGYIDYNEWMTQKFKMLTKERLALLEAVSVNFNNNIKLVTQVYTEDIQAIYGLQANWENLGFEGAMALPNIPYYLGKKTGRLLKFKTMLSQDCVITGIYEGKAGTRLEGKMGGVVLRQENGNTCECGTGWTDEDREIMWNNQELYIGGLIETKYQELTPDGIMRFPVFVRWRNDK